MPTILTINGFTFEIYTRNEHRPAHIHVWRAGNEVIINLEDASYIACEAYLYKNRGMVNKDANFALTVVQDNYDLFMQAWRKIHG